MRPSSIRLDESYRRGLERCERRTFVTSHAAFGHLARRYGLTQLSLAGASPEAEPGPRELEGLIDDVRASGATTVFAEPLVSDRIAETVAREAGAEVAVLDPLEGLSEERLAAGEDYLTVMRDQPRRAEGGPRMSLAVELSGVSFAYRAACDVLEDVDLRIGEGEFVAIAGPNGGGKTTLVRHRPRPGAPVAGDCVPLRGAGPSLLAASHARLSRAALGARR